MWVDVYYSLPSDSLKVLAKMNLGGTEYKSICSTISTHVYRRDLALGGLCIHHRHDLLMIVSHGLRMNRDAELGRGPAGVDTRARVVFLPTG